MTRAAGAVLLILLALPAHGETFAELGFAQENLDNGFDDWGSEYFFASRNFAPRQTLYGELRHTRRFKLDDSDFTAGYYHPLSERLTGVVEAAVSPTHEVLPKFSLFGQLETQLGSGFGLHFGFRHTEYNQLGTNVSLATIERYWSSYRAAYTYYLGKPENAGSAGSHRFQLAYYYGERNSIGAGYTFGREVERVSPQQVLSTDVDSYVISGVHWMRPEWGLSYDLTWHEQGDLYTRSGFRLGLRHLF